MPELDFRQEASNAERCRSNLEASSSTVRGRVVVPAVVHARTSARVLTMEYADGAGEGGVKWERGGERN